MSPTPLYTVRMEQASSKMSFLPTEIHGFTYTAEKGLTLNRDSFQYCSLVVPCAPTDGGGGETCYPQCDTSQPTCNTCAETCPNTCFATCPDTCWNTCPLTCDDLKCIITCIYTCLTCYSTCEGPTCIITCMETCGIICI
jgi:hypothetical protein